MIKKINKVLSIKFNMKFFRFQNNTEEVLNSCSTNNMTTENLNLTTKNIKIVFLIPENTKYNLKWESK